MYEYQEHIHELARQLRKYSKVAVISHLRPDGDAIGSQVGLALWLKAGGITPVLYNEDADNIPGNIQWIPEDAGLSVKACSRDELDACEALIFVDGNAPARFASEAGPGVTPAYFEQTTKPCYLIDHHPQPSEGYHVMASFPEAASTAELVYFLYEQTNPEILSIEAAAALYAGIATDTGSFRFDSVGPHLHRIVAEMMEQTCLRPAEIHQRIYDNRDLRQLKLIGRALEHIELHGDEDWLATMYVKASDLEETGCSYQDTEGLIAFALSLRSVKAGVIFTEKDERIKMSFRSKNELNVNHLARKFQGGGHQKAAGGWYDGPLEEAIKEVSEAALAMQA
jgi:phosphoesterase RecJ-like protein